MENEVKNSANTSEDLVALRSKNEKLKAEIEDLKQTLERLMVIAEHNRHKKKDYTNSSTCHLEEF